ncbi:MAG: C10 family peptidase, partial [Prevotella sp.]|nr:C10 family peptidase [Prevotella sp.]
MKRYLLTVFSLVYAFVVFAGSVTEKQALAKACQFMPGKSFVFVRTAESGKMNSSGNVPYYIFNAENNGGFVIVSGDDRTKAILGYSESGSLKGNDLPENVESWLNYYAEAISSLEDSSPNVRYVNATSAKRSDISPLITTKWSQRTPYNDQCVFEGLGSCVTGCVATAFAQVLNYYQYPNKVAAMDKYTRNGTDTIPALPGATLDWKNMCATYNQWEGNRTDAQKKAVATLMRYCGQSVLMNYGPYSSGGKDWTIPTALKQYFGYDDCAQCIYRSNYSDEDWENTIYQELSGKHPIIYTGFTTAGGGHCFVVDGYKKKDSTYHVNWGWGGSCDGYFVLTVMNASESSVYDQNQRAIIGVRPLEGKVKLSKSKVTLEAGKTLTLKATVSPEKLLDKSVTWKSSDKKVATVTSKGKVTAVKAGTATITCTS